MILLFTTESLLRICRRKSNRAESSSVDSLLKDAISLRRSDDTAELCFFSELQCKQHVKACMGKTKVGGHAVNGDLRKSTLLPLQVKKPIVMFGQEHHRSEASKLKSVAAVRVSEHLQHPVTYNRHHVL